MSATAPKISRGGMRAIDEPLLEEVRAGEPDAVVRLEVSRSRPYLDLEVISDPSVDHPHGAEEEGSTPAELVEALARRYERLRRPFVDSPPDLVVCRGAPPIDDRMLARLAEASEHGLALAVQSDPESPAAELAAVFRVFLRNEDSELPDRTLDEAFAHLVILGWSDGLGARGGFGAEESERLLQALTESDAAKNAPLHVVLVTAGDEDPGGLLRECERLRVSLVLANAERGTSLVTSSRAGQQPGQGPTSVSVARCPDFKAGTAASGMARVRLDLWRGEAEVAVRRDLGSDLDPPPVQVACPLLSASRVASSERRLRSRVDRLLGVAAKSADETELSRIERFEQDLKADWKESGYVTLCTEAGQVPLPVTRHTRYELLLVVRERDDGYDIMMSHHSPLRASLLADWNTLLLPAFKDVRALLEHLRDDVLRQAQERAEDFERLAHARAFEQAVERILDDEDAGQGDELWADEVRAVAERKIRKISPTTGAVTEFDYRLVTLLPLVDRTTAEPEDDGDDQRLRRQRGDRRRIVEWLDGLDTVTAPGEGRREGLPIEALQRDGCGLRWDPASGLRREPGAEDRRRLRQAAPGAIWFPLSGRGERPIWRDCPAIVSRNLDVMAWVEAELERAGGADGSLPDELVLGKRDRASASFEFEGEIFPFEGTGRARDPEVPATSTVDALELVRFAERSDLAQQRAYAGAKFERAFLRREEVPVGAGARSAILVYDAIVDEKSGRWVARSEPRGVLRPVQRYVLKSGIERAEEINRVVLSRLAAEGDEWGFLRVRKGGAPQAISATPPIIEQVTGGDLEGCADDLTEFLVCDGNHRIVQRVWEGGEGEEQMAAVAVVGELAQPYYARPFGRFEWEATAGNELSVTPDLASKYLARKVDWDEDLDDAGREALAGIAKPQLYRRYFRELDSGFGYMGGQGGRYF
jgi:hypothetical protein